MKTCNTCKTIKPKTSFSKHKRMHDGLQSKCKECEKLCNKERAELLKNYRTSWVADNVNYGKQWRINNKEYANNYYHLTLKYNNLYKEAQKIRTLINKAITRKYFDLTYSVYYILGCDYNTFINHIQNQFTDGMCWDNRYDWDLDHIIPLSFANKIEDVYILNHYSNIQPLSKQDNKAKFKTLPENVEKKFLELTELYNDFQKKLKK